MEKRYQDINSETIDRWCAEGWEWGQPITHETYLAARAGSWDVLLTPTKPVPHEWFGCLTGKKVLGLASGGGQQMPIFAALGANCTVLDYSQRQLDSEKEAGIDRDYARISEEIAQKIQKIRPRSFGTGAEKLSSCIGLLIIQACFQGFRGGGAGGHLPHHAAHIGLLAANFTLGGYIFRQIGGE